MANQNTKTRSLPYNNYRIQKEGRVWVVYTRYFETKIGEGATWDEATAIARRHERTIHNSKVS